MAYNTMRATITGKTCEGRDFQTDLVFTLIPPKDGNHYGTGYYMTVEFPSDTQYIDVRYERTTDIEILADRFIKNYFGNNAQDVVKCFD